MILGTVTWETFINTRVNPRGVQFQFEDLCRQLFKNDFLKNNNGRKKDLIHSNPNHPGLEADPVFDENSNRWIGYQVKFFENNVNYREILKSAKQIVQHYSRKVDDVYLFCNKPIKNTAKTYLEIEALLKASNIEIILVTDNEILDRVRKYPYLANYYFNAHTITHDWIVEHTQQVVSTLGERYNANFNVDTNSSLQLSLFTHDEEALKYLNGKKENLLKLILRYNSQFYEYKEYLRKVQEVVEDIPDISFTNIINSLDWESKIQTEVQDEIKCLRSEKSALEKELLEDEEKHDKSNFYINKRRNDINRKIANIEKLLTLPHYLTISKNEELLLTQKTLMIKGKVGTGKTQLLTNETMTLINGGRTAVLFNAGVYYTEEPIQEQIMKNCSLSYSLDDMIDILEAIGEQTETIVPIFIDAINETSNKYLWEDGLENIIRKIESTDYVRIAFSYRSDYEKLLLKQTVSDRLHNNEICSIFHNGFADNSLKAARTFFDFYKIPFSPFEYFSNEVTNPLFLTLYCKTYEGDEVSLPELFKRVLKHANKNIHRSMKSTLQKLGYLGTEDILTPFIKELTNFYIEKGCRAITKNELKNFQYWKDTGISRDPYISQLKKENVIYEYVHGSEEYLYFSYDQMNDYFCAEAILSSAKDEDEIKQCIIEKVLKIRNKKIENYGNQDIFINICILYAEKYGEECIEIIDNIDNEMGDKDELFAKFIRSYQWRRRQFVSAKEFVRLVKKYGACPGDVWDTLITNSVKKDHPLNANFLHQLLSGYLLSERDEYWTKYINGLFSEEDNRISQLICSYNKGEYLEINDEKQVELLLTLFSWLLTSSDRYLRDYTSKAMIEILKNNFDFCEKLLEKFKDINDPYVVQRLYGIVFGSCCKRIGLQQDIYQSLAEYVYKSIFDQEIVYPDILLRDYARLIIERFLWEFDDYEGNIDKEKIKPPYKSEAIPHVNVNYDKEDYQDGFYAIQSSMRFANMGFYGDFGRYVFESALNYFDVDLTQIYNYAMSFIINDLGYSEKLSSIDKVAGFYNRYTTKKVERIGKKYQWIAMYNILARVSDNYKMINNFASGDEGIFYEGTWNPDVRDFDPTLNINFMKCSQAPYFEQIDKYITEAQEENRKTLLTSNESKENWLNKQGVFLTNAKDNIILMDEDAVQWVSMTKHSDTGRKKIEKTNLYVWGWMHAFFVTEKQAEELQDAFGKGTELLSEGFTNFCTTYETFNREYPWSPSCRKLREYSWQSIYIKTGEKETITEKQPRIYGLNQVEDGEESDWPIKMEIREEMVTYERDVKKYIGEIMYADTELYWGEEYDATKDESISIRVPCIEIINKLKLRQKEFDGFYFDEHDRLAAFDTSLNGQKWGLVIRKDLLDDFLAKMNMKLIWFLQSSQEIHNKELSIENRSDWSALFVYEKGKIKGLMRREKM